MIFYALQGGKVLKLHMPRQRVIGLGWRNILPRCFKAIKTFLSPSPMESCFLLLKKIYFIHLFSDWGREEERESNMYVWLPVMCPLPDPRHVPQTENRTRGPLVHRLAFNPLSHSSQGNFYNCQSVFLNPFHLFQLFPKPFWLFDNYSNNYEMILLWF